MLMAISEMHESGDLRLAVMAYLRNFPGASASKIGRAVGATRSEVNSVLYAGKGEDFIKVEGQPPRWELRAKFGDVATRVPDRNPAGEIHVDAQGGDWTVSISTCRKSRNDPIYEAEALGERRRHISVSSQVSANSVEPDFEGMRDEVVAVAAAALAWEIALNRGAVVDPTFEFAQTMTEVYLALAAHGK